MASQGVNMDQFEAYFKRADLDGDGRISGAEAVAFLQGSNLPKQVLAQIWTFADQSRTGFLTRPEFYNALRLVTVAQSKRDLSPDIVKAALYGPAAAKIPPPQIALASSPVQQINALAAASAAPQIGAAGSQSLGFRGPGLVNQQPQFGAQAMPGAAGFRPTQGVPGPQFGGMGRGFSQPMPSGNVPRPVQSVAASGVPSSNVSANWLGGSAGGASAGFRGVTPSSTGVSLQPQTAVMSQPQSLALVPAQPAVTDAKTSVSGNGFDSFFGGDAFSAGLSAGKQEPSAASKLASSISLPVSSTGPKPPVKSSSLDSLQSAYATQPLGGQIPRAHSAQSLPTVTQQGSSPSSSPLATVGVSVGGGAGTTPDNLQSTWPKMKPTDIQKYTKVFVEVDTDRDGRITGEQARNLFLSWRLPREVLKQVWDLADQDNDSMLSLREFCFALYLMERFREGRPLPTALPSNVMYDETLLSMTSLPKVGYGNSAWGPGSGMGFGEQPGMGPRPITSTTGLRPPVPLPAGSTPQVDGIMASNQQKARGPALDDSFLNRQDADQNSMTQDGTPSDKKVNETEKIILDSKEKIEYYRSKMQDLVLYKSRCDNRLNEITERAIADKRESELLGKKYEEKYKQVAEAASKLTIEEATFRDVQARKSELQQAIVNMERGGSADGILQVRADRIQSDLDELMKVLTERCKKHNLEIKSAALIELPTGWQPGIQEGAVVWDEDWDKFEDEGFSNEVSVDVNDSAKSKTAASQNGIASPDSLSNGDVKSGIFNTDHVLESESAYGHSEDESARSPQDSPAGRTAVDGASPGFSDVFAKSSEADAETHRSFDDSTWGAFDTNDDVDSVWGFNPAKDTDSDKHRDFFGSDDFGVKPIRTESPSTESIYQKKSPFFEDSVPATPLSRFGNSPRYSEAGDHFDNFSRFDSFSVQEGGFSPREKLTRFDSINSTKDFGHSRAFSSFDDSDPFGSSGPFKVSSDDQTQTPKKSGSWSAF